MIKTNNGTIFTNDVDETRSVLIEEWLTIEEAFINLRKILVVQDDEMSLFEPVFNSELGFCSYRFTEYDKSIESQPIILRWGGFEYHHFAPEFGEVISHCAYEMLRKMYADKDPEREEECKRRLRALEKIIIVFEGDSDADLQEAEIFLVPVKNSRELELIYHELCAQLEFTNNAAGALKDFLEISGEFVNKLNKLLNTNIEIAWSTPNSDDPLIIAKVLLEIISHKEIDREFMHNGFFAVKEIWRMFTNEIAVPTQVTKDSVLPIVDYEFSLIVENWEKFRRLKTTQPRP